MITPGDEIPIDDTFDNDKEDQMSQEDVHSNGFDDEVVPPEDDHEPDTDKLEQAYDAAEPSFTLNTDDEPAED